jgi:RHS repeat-associated protein
MTSIIQRASAACLSLVALALPTIACAQLSGHYTYADEINKRQNLAALDEELFGDKISLQTGMFAFEQNDVVVNTNGSMKIVVGRKTPAGAANTGIFGADWMINMPYMYGLYDTRTGWNSGGSVNRCSIISGPNLGPRFTYPPPATDTNDLRFDWAGITISIPGSGDEELLKPNAGQIMPTDGKTYVGTTKSGARISCLPALRNGAGEGFSVTTSDGTVYRFDWMASVNDTMGFRDVTQPNGLYYPLSHVFIFPSEVTDRFGNKLTYTYNSAVPQQLTSIVSSSDGARADLQYDAIGRVASVTSGTRTWRYTYTSVGTPPVYLLNAVILPDGAQWTFSGGSSASYGRGAALSVLNPNEWRTPGKACSAPGSAENLFAGGSAPTIKTTSMVHPSGAKGEFSYKLLYHGTNNTPTFCTHPPLSTEWLAASTPAINPSISLVKKKISGPGLLDRTWDYSYKTTWSVDSQCVNGTCANTSSTVVSTNDGITRTHVFGNDFKNNFGQLLSTTLVQGGATKQISINEFLTTASGQLFPDDGGITPTANFTRVYNVFLNKNRPHRKLTITQDGMTFVSEKNAFDRFVRPTSVTKSNSIGYIKTDVTEYHDNVSSWVLGQVKRQYNVETGMVMSQTDYNAQALPWKTYSFGKLQQILNYWPDGNLSTVTDGRNNTTTLGDYYRGIPRLIGHPATPEAPAGATLSATVDPNGWITSVTNEIGAKTCYGYDAMGRLASIVYPSETQLGVCDTSRWSPVSLSFVPVNYDEHGLPAGHWRASRYEGNKHVNTYYDAMWRPVLEEALDVTNIAGTVSQVVKKYDTGGRLSFQSYPANNVGHYADVTQGTRTFYDALDRVTRVEQDSEQDVLVTTTDYWPNLQVRVVNPRSQATVTAFMAWDQPTYELPIASVQPEGKVIEIARHPQFGWPLQLKQRSADNTLQQIRKYVYDGNAQLCKTIEPETGATVTGYDAANNPAWSASGLTGVDYASTADCSYTAANASGRVVNRTYDNRNRLKTLLFPDGRGNQVWNYEPDGQPKDITTFNNPSNTTPVVNGYEYNKRRLLTKEYSHQPGWYTWNLGYDYDPMGNLRSQSYPTGLTVDYAPNALGQPTGVRDQNNKVYASNAGYYSNGALKQFTYGNGIVHSMTQNARQLPMRVTDVGALDNTYAYDPNGNPITIRDVNAVNGQYSGNRDLEYDGLDRLKHAHLHWWSVDYWTYDALDNIRRNDHFNGSVTTAKVYNYDTDNRLFNIQNEAGAAIVGLGYDPQGNWQNKNGQAYDFDYGNRLRGVTLKEYYRYDGLGRRVLNWRYPTASTPNGAVLVSQYSQSGQLMYQEGSPEGASEHIYLAGSLIATRNNGVSKYQHTDALGSPVAVTNEAGTVIERNDYEPYGAVIGQPNKNGIGYTGHMMDGATGLTYMQQRYYDQSIGRFLSVDPVTADGGTGANFNRYWYANGNPYKFVDPDGRQSRETLNPPSSGTGVPYLDSLLKPSDVQAMGKGQMMQEQFASELSRPMSWRERLTYIAIAMSAGNGAAGRGAGPTARTLSAEGKALVNAQPVGSALKSDSTHRAASFVRQEAAEIGTHTPLVGGDGVTRTLTQMPGGLNGQTGRYEYIVEKGGNLTHQRFVANGTINGVPNKP